MSCNLSTYEQYPVKQVLFDKATNKYVVKLLNPPPSCQDGNLVNGRTVVRENSDVAKSVLSFSTELKAPVVLLRRGESVVQVRDPSETPTTSSGFGFFGWLLIITFVVAAIYILRKAFRNREEESSNDTTPPPSSRPSRSYEPPSSHTSDSRPSAPSPQGPSAGYSHQQPRAGSSAPQAPAPQAQTPVTVINNGGGGNNGDFVTGMVVGSLLNGGNHGSDRETIIHEREVIREVPGREESRYEAPRETAVEEVEEKPSESFSSDSDNSYSSDSGSSYSSDSSSSYNSDSSDSGGSSFSSDD